MATIKTLSSVQAIIEASLTTEEGELWLGGRYATEENEYIWEDGTSIFIDNPDAENQLWAPDNPLTGILYLSYLSHLRQTQ